MNRKNRKYLLNKLQEIKLYLILHTLVTYRFVFSFKRQKVKHPQCIKHPQWIKSIYSIINESQKAVYVTSSTVGCTLYMSGYKPFDMADDPGHSTPLFLWDQHLLSYIYIYESCIALAERHERRMRMHVY